MVSENGPVKSGADEKKSNESTKTDNSRHHSLLLQVRKACNQGSFFLLGCFSFVC